jgi:hypothetical protein
LFYAASFTSCYVVARSRQQQPVPGEAWASGHQGVFWSDLGFLLLIVAGGLTISAIRFAYHKAG